MAETAADLEARLASVRAQKALPKVDAFNGRSITTRDLDELDRLEAQLVAQLAALTSPTTTPPRMFYLYGSKGT